MRIFFQQNVLRLLGLLMCLAISLGHISEFFDGNVVRVDIPLHSVATWLAKGVNNFDLETRSLLLSLLPSSDAVMDNAGLAFVLFFASYVLLCMLFMLIFWRLSAPSSRHTRPKILLLLALCFAISLIQMSDLALIVSMLFALLLPVRTAAKCLGLQLLLYSLAQVLLVWSGRIDAQLVEQQVALLARAVELPNYVILFFVAYWAKQERARRQELLAANAELLATEMLLTETVKNAERRGMARDVHDVLGHQLTALNLHLDLAQRQSDSAGLDNFVTALEATRELARTLLRQVRSVVSVERQDQLIEMEIEMESKIEHDPKLDPMLDPKHE